MTLELYFMLSENSPFKKHARALVVPHAGQRPNILFTIQKSGKLTCWGFKNINISITVPNVVVIPSGLLKDMHCSKNSMNLFFDKRIAICIFHGVCSNQYYVYEPP